MRNDEDARLEAVAAMLERLALEIRSTVEQRSSCMPTAREQSDGEAELLWTKGARVRVTIRDRYYGRTGTLLGRRGKLYWDFKIDPLDGEVAKVIFKKQSSLTLINEA
jgi:ribosomal protein L21E